MDQNSIEEIAAELSAGARQAVETFLAHEKEHICMSCKRTRKIRVTAIQFDDFSQKGWRVSAWNWPGGEDWTRINGEALRGVLCPDCTKDRLRPALL